MLGDKIGEVKGKRIVRRVLSVDPPTAEVSFEDAGPMFGVATTGIGSYTSVIQSDGSLHGTGQGLITTEDGESITWTGTAMAILVRAVRSAIAACSFSGPRQRSWPASITPVGPLSTT
jgi:hypothetical protein